MVEFGFVDTAWDFIVLIFLIFGGGIFTAWLSRFFRVPASWALLYFAWHSLLSFIFALYSTTTDADSTFYYEASVNGLFYGYFGLGFPIFFTHPFSAYLNFNYLNCFLVFNIVGFIGVLAFAGSIRQKEVVRQSWPRLLFPLFPGLNFWTGMIGKDSFAMLSVGLLCWSLTGPRHARLITLASILSMAFVRPHIAFMIAVSLMVHEAMKAKGSPTLKVTMLSVLAGGIAIAIPFLFEFFGLQSDGQDLNIGNYIEQKQDGLVSGTTGIRLSEMSLPLRLFAYGFRPLFIDAPGSLGLLASVENTILLAIFLAMIWKWFRFRSTMSLAHQALVLAYVLLVWISLSTITGNLGTAIRQKWMFLPPVLMFALTLTVPRFRRKISSPTGNLATQRPAGAYTIDQWPAQEPGFMDTNSASGKGHPFSSRM